MKQFTPEKFVEVCRDAGLYEWLRDVAAIIARNERDSRGGQVSAYEQRLSAFEKDVAILRFRVGVQ